MQDNRTFAQRWADIITEFCGSWTFIWCFVVGCALWILINSFDIIAFDKYPFLFLNWVLTVLSTITNPLIMLSNNRQNDRDRLNVEEMRKELQEIKSLLKDKQ